MSNTEADEVRLTPPTPPSPSVFENDKAKSKESPIGLISLVLVVFPLALTALGLVLYPPLYPGNLGFWSFLVGYILSIVGITKKPRRYAVTAFAVGSVAIISAFVLFLMLLQNFV